MPADIKFIGPSHEIKERIDDSRDRFWVNDCDITWRVAERIIER